MYSNYIELMNHYYYGRYSIIFLNHFAFTCTYTAVVYAGIYTYICDVGRYVSSLYYTRILHNIITGMNEASIPRVHTACYLCYIIKVYFIIYVYYIESVVKYVNESHCKNCSRFKITHMAVTLYRPGRCRRAVFAQL